MKVQILMVAHPEAMPYLDEWANGDMWNLLEWMDGQTVWVPKDIGLTLNLWRGEHPRHIDGPSVGAPLQSWTDQAHEARTFGPVLREGRIPMGRVLAILWVDSLVEYVVASGGPASV